MAFSSAEIQGFFKMETHTTGTMIGGANKSGWSTGAGPRATPIDTPIRGRISAGREFNGFQVIDTASGNIEYLRQHIVIGSLEVVTNSTRAVFFRSLELVPVDTGALFSSATAHIVKIGNRAKNILVEKGSEHSPKSGGGLVRGKL